MGTVQHSPSTRTDRDFIRSSVLRAVIITGVAVILTIFATIWNTAELPDDVRMRAFFVACILPIAVAAPTLGYIARQDLRNYRLMREVTRLALTDELTGLANRRAFMGKAEARLMAQNGCHGQTAAMIIDIDYFKRVNDEYGHDTGDIVLKCVAGQISRALPDASLVARFGGEEFVALVDFDQPTDLHQKVEYLRRAVATAPCWASGQRVLVTISIGVSITKAEDTVSAVLSRADTALYTAKNSGRNQFAIAA